MKNVKAKAMTTMSGPQTDLGRHPPLGLVQNPKNIRIDAAMLAIKAKISETLREG